MKRAVIYVRVSSREQAEGGYSIEAQLEACRRYVRERGWSLAHEYVDSGESATTASRPNLQKMLSDLSSGEQSASFVVVHKIDRLARNVADHVGIRGRLKKREISLVSVSENLEDTPSGRMVENILASVAAWYSENLGQETKKGMTQKARNGIWPTFAPIGYLNVREDAGRKAESLLALDDERAPLVRQAFELYATGQWTLTSLHAELKRRGLRTRRGVVPSRAKLAEMLKHKIYMGVVCWGGQEYTGRHEPLVSAETFARVQKVFKEHDKSGPRTTKHEHYLRGSLYCASCGSRLSSMVAKGRFPYFFCIGRMQRRTNCQEPYVPVERLERNVEEIYGRIRLSEDGRRAIAARLDRELADQSVGGAREVARYARRIAQLQAQREKLLQAYLKEAISVELLKVEQDRIDEEEADIRTRMSVDRSVLEKARQAAEVAMDLLRSCGEAYVNAKERARRNWNRALFKAIYVGDGLVKRYEYQEPLGALFAYAGSNSVHSGSPDGIRTHDLFLEREAP